MKNLIKINDYCYECNGIRVREIGPEEYEIRFLNGTMCITLDPSKPLALGTGCGSGKTTAFCLLMLLRVGKGVLYITNRTDDLDRVYNWLMENAVGEAFLDEFGNPFVLKKEDIFNLHNNTLHDENGNILNGADINAYNKDHSILRNFRILLATSYKFTHENPVDLTFMNYSANNSYMSLQEQAMSGILGRNSVRSIVLIDELISCEPLYKIFTRTSIEYLGDCKSYRNVFNPSSPDPYVFYSRPPYEVFMFKYKRLIEDRKELNASKSDPVKNELLAGSLYNSYDSIVRSLNREGKDEVTICNNIMSFILNGSKIPLVLAEGTAEYLMLDTIDKDTGLVVSKNKFELLTYPNKYNSPINIERFNNPIPNRRISDNELTDIITGKSLLIPKINELGSELSKILSYKTVNKSLIFTWMNLKSKDEKLKSNDVSILTQSLNENFDLVKYLSERVIPPEGKSVVFSHYQSGEDKATNDYRDFDTIIFSGYFRIPSYSVSKLNEYYGYNANQDSYTLHQVIQAICRTRIRNHRGESVNVYFSSDWPEYIINEVQNHLSNSKVGLNIVKTDTTLDWIPNKWRSKVRVLMDFDKGFKTAIISKTGYTLNIRLDDIFNLIPMAYKKSARYSSLRRYLLTELSIHLNII